MTLTDPLKEALSLFNRFQESELFRRYVESRMWLVAPAALAVLFNSLACALGIVLFVGGTRSALVLLALVLAPFVLVGSALVQGYLLLAWLEGRALARSLGHPARLRIPASAWLLAAAFLGLPVGMLLATAPGIGLGVMVLLVAGPAAFAWLDR